MTSFTFSLDQLRSAPPEVRRWVENEIAAALSGLTHSEHGPSEPHSAELTACTPEEALKVFELIKGNFLLSQVFFELAREMPNSGSSAPLHTLNIGELLRHTRRTGIASPIVLPRSTRRFRMSAATPRRRSLALTHTAVFISTRRPTRAFAGCGSSWSPLTHPVRAARSPPAMAVRRRSALPCLISARVRTSPSMSDPGIPVSRRQLWND